MQKLNKENLKWFFYTIGLASIVIGYLRLWFGVDFLDEAWYISLIQQFSLGAKPFVDEFSFQQMSFFLISPFFKFFYHGVDTNYSGAVLLVRHFYFIIVSCTAITGYLLFKRFVRKDISFALSSLFFVDVYAIPSVSYNTIGRLGFFTGAALLALTHIDNKRNSTWLSVLSGFTLLISVLSYPPLIVPAFFLFILAIIYGWRKVKQPKSSCISATVFMMGLLCLLIFIYPLRNEVILSLQMMKTLSPYAGGIYDKLAVIANLSLLIGVPLALIFAYKKARHQSNLLFISIVFLMYSFALFGTNTPGFQYARFLSCLSFFALFIYLFFKNDFTEGHFQMFIFVLLPLLASGITTSLVSANGYSNICVGISPAAIISLFFVHEIFKMNSSGEKYFLTVLLASLIIYSTILFSTIYGEKSVTQLSAQVSNGPYWGLFTEPDKADFVNLLFEQLNRPEVRSRATILSYYNFPAGYLFTPIRSNSYSTWTMSWFYSRTGFENLLNLVKKKQEKFFLNAENIAEVIIRYRPKDPQYNGIPDGLNIYDPITDMINDSNYKVLFTNPLFEIYVKENTQLNM